ncbi:DUF167 domain-containing protein [Hydrogenimonas cancrithermarum]|uniref:UPF0235 protein HCR_16680 n=1 Tax=Hydrogenimonas cancrithermarum TaxID=2993563 RepID=A0ABN6WW84_9BACT|nr:DUF167 family protein [Hydrogenimonas cancrithermarum]BDY13356.1 YggU family protein [Hydrogenimonas cancrithermarum]
MWYDERDETVDLYIDARPASSRNEVAGIFDDTLKIKIKAPAVEGAANKELVKFLSKRFKIPKSSIHFVSGERSKRKRIRLPKTESVVRFIEEVEAEN